MLDIGRLILEQMMISWYYVRLIILGMYAIKFLIFFILVKI